MVSIKKENDHVSLTKQQVKQKLKEALSLLNECDIAISELNSNEHQFDYVSDPALSDIVDSVTSRAINIDRLVYQKKGKRR